MYLEELSAVMSASEIRIAFMKRNPLGYFLASLLGGAYIGFGNILSFTIGGMLTGQPYIRVVMGVSFGIALSLVVFAGAELFTGNNFIMALGVMGRKITWIDTLKLWGLCYLGNWLGAIILSLLFAGTGLGKGAVGEFIARTAALKMGLELVPLFLRAILCNILVCLAIWSGYRCKTESGKLIMIFWCLFAFITSGFEHSIANMTLLTTALLLPHGIDVSLGGYFYNIIVVSFGNMLGAILGLAVPYFFISRNKEM
jgi:nitrite transporter NirC